MNPFYTESALGEIRLRSGSATVAASTTWTPVSIRDGVARWEDQSSSILAGRPSFTLSVRPPSKQAQNVRIIGKFAMPIMATIADGGASGYEPLPQVGFVNYGGFDIQMSQYGTLTQRNNLLCNMICALCETVNASDDSPIVTIASPLRAAAQNFTAPY